MWSIFVILAWFILLSLAAWGWRAARLREVAAERFAEATLREASEELTPASVVGTRRLHRPWRWVPWALMLLVFAVTSWWVRLSPPFVIAAGLMVGLLASQVEAFVAAMVVARLETQLADAIDIMIGAVGAGASVGAAMDAAIIESRQPLRPYLEELAGRIRLGDDPAVVFRSLAERVPLETVLLFSSALSVHWEVGGKLTSTLTAVGRTIRDRIDVSRRIQSNIAQSQFSTLAIVGLTYFIAVIIWRNGPEQMEEFVRSSVGSWFVAGSIVLQAVGVVWMNMISKPHI